MGKARVWGRRAAPQGLSQEEPMIRASLAVSLLAMASLVSGSAGAFAVGPAPTLDELIRQADFIGKVTVLDSVPVADPWFNGVRGFEPVQTQLKVLATYKGDP